LTECPSYTVSSPTETTGIATMIEPPMASPVATETMPANSRISDRGSGNRRRMARAMLSDLAASLLDSYWVSRCSASLELRLSNPQ
jgi:hypothetical protein